METTKPRTTLLMLLVWALVCGATVGSSLPKRELQMLEMMRNLLRVDGADLSGRSQRSVPLLYASSVSCDDSLAEDTSDQLSLLDEDFDSSEECGEYGRPCQGSRPAPSELEPCPYPLVPRHHPCYVRVVVLHTPLMQHDPCTNFTLGMAQPASASASASDSSTTTTPTTTTDDTNALKGRRKGKRCRPKAHKGKHRLAAIAPIRAHDNDASSSTADPDTSTSDAETTTDTMPSTTPITTVETTTEINTTVSSVASTPTETIPTTTLVEPSTIPMLPSTTTTETSRSTGSRHIQLKSARGRRRKQKNGSMPAGVPDRPKIKLDGAMLPSDACPVFLTTEAPELRSRAISTTLCPETAQTAMPSESETTDCVEDSDDEEATTESGENRARAGQGNDSDSEDCEEAEYAEDAEDQDTNICPQFSPPEEAGNGRLMPSRSRYRKPVKNYVEPILYEGQFTKPRQRMGMLPPGQRDFYVSNKQIMPRPKPKVREPLPHSIYMNNIVRGIKCSDESDPFGHPAHDSHSSNPTNSANAAYPLNPGHSLHPSHLSDPAHSSNPLHPSHPLYPSHPANLLRPSHPLHLSNRRYHPRQPSSGQRDWPGRRNGPDCGPIGPQPDRPGQQRGRGNPLFGLRSGEDSDSYGHDSDQYYDDDSSDNVPWPRNHPLHPAPPTSDLCQAEHSREAERKRQRQRENDRDDNLQDYPQRSAPRFFT